MKLKFAGRFFRKSVRSYNFGIDLKNETRSSKLMTKRVLNVGQCVPDNASISRMLQKNFQVEIEQGHQAADTLGRLREKKYDLVLINRKLDADYTDGLDIIRTMKADAHLKDIPVMLVSNYPEHQDRAVAEGAEPGFGKMELGTPSTLTKLQRFLA